MFYSVSVCINRISKISAESFCCNFKYKFREGNDKYATHQKIPDITLLIIDNCLPNLPIWCDQSYVLSKSISEKGSCISLRQRMFSSEISGRILSLWKFCRNIRKCTIVCLVLAVKDAEISFHANKKKGKVTHRKIDKSVVYNMKN